MQETRSVAVPLPGMADEGGNGGAEKEVVGFTRAWCPEIVGIRS